MLNLIQNTCIIMIEMFGGVFMDEKITGQIMLDGISEGVIAVDNNNKICFINKKAKEIFGITYKQDIGHREGKINKGDIVIIGDTSIGLDDGSLTDNDLEMLGIHERILPGTAFVYIGRYLETGDIRIFNETSGNSLFIKEAIENRQISAEINFIKKTINIKVDETEFPYYFVKSIGHMVILDGKSFEIKFYQAKGYSIRKEDIKSILTGSHYSEKLKGIEMETDVIGEKINEVLGDSESIRNIAKCSMGEKIDYKKRYDEVNGRPVRCSIKPLIIDKKTEGAYAVVEDLSEINRLSKEKDEMFHKLLEIDEKSYDPFNQIVGDSAKIQSIKLYAKKAALSSSTILLLGESGTGKSIMARAIHDYSRRKNNRFVEINCGSLSSNLLESELFGYVPGAFTGAKKEGKKGLIEYADGGTLFLDEISEMPIELQVKLLHVLQESRIIPVGATEYREVDVRFICASNRDIKKMAKEGTFREDLFYRIDVIPIEIPPLRERKQDLYYLTQSILHKLCKKNNIPYKGITNKAFNKLYSYDFPGNIRELENIIERALNVVDGDYIDENGIIITSDKQTAYYSDKTLREAVDEAEKKTIALCMKKYNGDKIKVMKVLGIKKTAFYEKLKKYGLQDSTYTEIIPHK